MKSVLGPLETVKKIEDSDAVICPDWFVRTRRLLHTDTGEPAQLLRLLPWLALLRVVAVSSYVGRRVSSVSDPSVNVSTAWTLSVPESRSSHLVASLKFYSLY